MIVFMCATVVREAGSDVHSLVEELHLEAVEGRPALLVCGGADDLRGEELARARTLLGAAVAIATKLSGATVIDGGTATGVMALVGAARQARSDALPVLVGVAPAGLVVAPGSTSDDRGRVPLEPHHTHFALADSGEWGGETPLLFRLAEALARDAPVVTLMAGGGSVALAEAQESAKRGWPLFVIERTGGTADAVASSRASGASEDPVLREIASIGDVRCFDGSNPDQLARQLAWELQDEPVLRKAWVTFAGYDALATRLRRSFERTQVSILTLGAIATLVGLLHEEIGTPVLHWAAVATPLVVSTLIALAARRAAGKRWVLLRAAAEAIKAEIYRYRTRTAVYNDALLSGDNPAARQQVLARQLDAIEGRLMQTEASSGALRPYDGPLPPPMYGAAKDDDGLSEMDARSYLRIRVGDQLAYYTRRTDRLERRRNLFQVLAITGGGAGAILAAAGLEIWIGLSTAISAAALSYLGYLQVDNTIVAYNQTAAKLRALDREHGGRASQSLDAATFDSLVGRCEAALATELGGWVQQMNEALEELQARQDEAARKVQEER